MACMLDANVLSYAVQHVIGPQPKDDDARAMLAASHRLVSSLSEVWIPAIAFAEFGRRYDIAQLSIDPDSLRIEPFVGSHAIRAAELLRQHRALHGFCAKCLSVPTDEPCKKCARLRAVSDKVNDAYIVATAGMTSGVDVLYSCDSGPKAFARHFASLEVREPGRDFGPLFAEKPPGPA